MSEIFIRNTPYLEVLRKSWFNYIEIITAIADQIISAIPVDVDATIDRSCSPHITIVVAGYAETSITIATADFLDCSW